jgi:SAM-dependent methyltransferase
MKWSEYFRNIEFTLYRSAKIQAKYIDTIHDMACKLNSPVLLEVATGSGYTSVLVADLLRNKGARVIATDVEPELLAQTESNFGFVKNLSFRIADARNLPFRDNEVHIIFHQGFLEHFGDAEIVQMLKEQARVASAYIIIDVPNSLRTRKIQEFGDERFPSNKEWRALIAKAGLNVLFATGRRFTNTWKKFVPVFLRDTDWFHRTFGESTIFVCGKSARSDA